MARPTRRETPPPSVRPRALAWAALFAAPLVLGVLATADAERATVLGVEGPACLVGAALSPALCPGCGLSRATAMLLQGRSSEALELSPAALPLVLACAVGLFAQLAVLARGRRGAFHLELRAYGGRALAAALVACWLLRLL